MAKAINWPARYREEVISESTEPLRCAFRPGRLYFDHQYWVDGEEVDIRVNHKVIRKAVIAGDLKCCRIGDLSTADFIAQKSDLKSVEQVVCYLSEIYGNPLSEDSEITVVYYRNRPINPEIMEVEDDPHMVSG